MNKSPQPREESEEALVIRRILLQELARSETSISTWGDVMYPTQTKPLSHHIIILRKAMEEGDIATINLYGHPEGSWFPFALIIDHYLKALEN